MINTDKILISTLSPWLWNIPSMINGQLLVSLHWLKRIPLLFNILSKIIRRTNNWYTPYCTDIALSSGKFKTFFALNWKSWTLLCWTSSNSFSVEKTKRYFSFVEILSKISELNKKILCTRLQFQLEWLCF